MAFKKTNHQSGHEAEQVAAQHIQDLGYKILDVNWRTKVCEVDIIAQKQKVVYFIEVKYRSTTNQGSGLEYITPKKLSQMRFAAEYWVQVNNYSGQYDLACIELSADYVVTEFIESID